ncbi:PHP domain-containing protein [Aquibacillus rhizosphaerae]|uniref:PHP domain-containing protein n=1 Tax=Aquibacillus rhizosphaerae TaxID=3051431 RepID=A0ABT7L9E9_9BACI|nr:PHP-associated domain-containing protein [Aquibacillus sp. LR5S19]MDL4841195.1 PHP domain-containing protein [Aquibacillus sp. LR5S19]
MNIDFHSHVKISKKSKFMPEYFIEMMKEAKKSDLDALAMTEHFNTTRFQDIYDFLEAHYTYQNGYYNIDGLKLFPGIEVDIKEVGHILLIGSREDVLTIRNELSSNLKEENFISFNGLLDIAEEFNILKIGAHPFRESTPLFHLETDQLQRLDALDLNGKDLYAQGYESYSAKLTEFAQKVGLPIVGGSDTHQYLQYGSVINKLEKECETVDDLKICIHNSAYQVEVSPSLNIKVKSATLVKKLLKKLLIENKQSEMV